MDREETERAGDKDRYMEKYSERELVVQQFLDREEGIQHPSYDSELNFYEMVSDGRIEELNKKTDYADVDMKARGTLSEDPIRNLKYHVIVTIVMISRFCIEKGMDERVSYSLSDYYIRKIDEGRTNAELKQLHKEVIFDYAERMQRIKRAGDYSIHCIRAMDYIQTHLHEPIRLKDVAAYVKLEPTYLSRLFKQETGYGISDYITKEKVKVARNMLEYSDYSCTEIAEYLAYSSDSYFGKIFRQETMQTPREYRRSHYRKHWMAEKS